MFKIKFVYLILVLIYITKISCHNVVPIKQDSISKFNVKATVIKRSYDKFKFSFDIFLKQADNPKTLEAVVRNLILTRLENGTEIITDPRHPVQDWKFFTNRVGLFEWDDEGIISARFLGDEKHGALWYTFYESWSLMNYNFSIINKIRDEILENFEVSTVKQLDGNERICKSQIHVSRNNVEFVEVEETVNSDNCQTDDELSSISGPHADAYDLIVKDQLFTTDYTLKQRLIKYRTVIGDDETLEEGDIAINFDEFIPLADNLRLYQPRAKPFENVTVDPRSVLPFKAGFDLKYRVKIDMLDFFTKLNCSFDLNLREVGDNGQIFARITNIEYDENVENQTRELFQNSVDRLVVVTISEEGYIFYKNLDENIHPSTLGGRELYIISVKIDLKSINLLQNNGPNPFTNTTVLFDSFGEKCEAVRTYDKEQLKTNLHVDTLKTCQQSEKKHKLSGKRGRSSYSYNLDLVQKLNDDFKIVEYIPSIKYRNLDYDDDYIKGYISAKLIEQVPQQENDAKVFNLYGETLDKNFFEQ